MQGGSNGSRGLSPPPPVAPSLLPLKITNILTPFARRIGKTINLQFLCTNDKELEVVMKYDLISYVKV